MLKFGALFSPRAIMMIQLLSISVPVVADSLCFSMARTYYEQLYCEVRNGGYGKKLPGFYDFQRNDEVTQALLLKNPARNLGVDLIMPAKFSHPISVSTTPRQVNNVPATGDCRIEGKIIVCAEKIFYYRPNQHTSKLQALALTESNRMQMPVFAGSYARADNVNNYLSIVYEHYLDKMLVIGLGEATIAYGNFAYLFHDLNEKDINFADRFEKMYGYLKQDRQVLQVNRHNELPSSLVIDDCFPLQHYWVCQKSRKNIIFSIVNKPD